MRSWRPRLDELGDASTDDRARGGNQLTSVTHEFDGRVRWVHVQVGVDSRDHYIDDDERIRIALLMQ